MSDYLALNEESNIYLEKIDTFQKVVDYLNLLSNSDEDLKFIIKNPENFANSIFIPLAEKSIEIRNLIASNNYDIKDSSELYNVYKSISDIFGKNVFKNVCQKISIKDENIDILYESLLVNDEENQKTLLNCIENINSHEFLTSAKTYQQFKKRKNKLTQDFYTPLLEHFLNDLTLVQKSEFLLKIELLRKSGWAEYIQNNGNDSENNTIKELFKLTRKTPITNEDSQKIYNLYNDFYQTVSIPIVIEDRGLSVATVKQQRHVSLFKLATAGMPDGCVKGCPYFSNDKTLFVGWATINENSKQRLQWFRHIEGIDWAIENNIHGFEHFNNIDGTVVALASTSDYEDLSFLGSPLNDEEKASFQLIHELAETVRGMITHNGRFKEYISKLSSVLLIGSKSNVSFTDLDNNDVKDILITTLSNVCNTLNSNKCFNQSFLENKLTEKHQSYFQSIAELLGNISTAYPNEISFIKNQAIPVLLKLMKYDDSNNNSKIVNEYRKCCLVAKGHYEQDEFEFNAINEGLSRRKTERFSIYLKHLQTVSKIDDSQIKKQLVSIYQDKIYPKLKLILENVPYTKMANETLYELDHILNEEFIPYESSKDATNKMKKIKGRFNAYMSPSFSPSNDVLKLILNVFHKTTPFLNVCSRNEDRYEFNALKRFSKLTNLFENKDIQNLSAKNKIIVKEIIELTQDICREIESIKSVNINNLEDKIQKSIKVENSKNVHQQIDIDFLKKNIKSDFFILEQDKNKLCNQIETAFSKVIINKPLTI